MRILQIISSVDRRDGGTIEAVIQVGRALESLGHTSDVVTLDGPDAALLGTFPLTVHAVGPARSSYRYCPELIPWLHRHAAEYDLVVVNGLWQYGGYATRAALRPLGIPYIVYCHGMLDPWFRRAYPLKHLKKWLYWPWGEYRVLRDAAAVCFTTEEERVVSRTSFALYRCNERVVNFGTSPPEGDQTAQRAAFLARWPEAEGKRVLLFLGRIHPKKGCDILVRSFAAIASGCPDLLLVIAGPDQAGLRAELEDIALRHGVADRIIWTGMLEGDLKWGALFAAEAFVLSSHQENFGIAVAESLACGTPVLISNKVNIWREVERDNAGIVANDDDPGTIAMLEKWLALGPEDRMTIAANAKTCFDTHFAITRAAESLLDIARELNKRPRTPLERQQAA